MKNGLQNQTQGYLKEVVFETWNIDWTIHEAMVAIVEHEPNVVGCWK